MRDAIGGTFSITAIVIFLLIVNCFLAFSVNYTKAFRAKNEVRSIIEKSEGLGCDALHRIENILSTNHYRIGDPYETWCKNNGYKIAMDSNNTPLFCYKVEKVDITGAGDNKKAYKGAYYTIATFVNIDIPIFNKVFEGIGNVFMVKGETALIYSSGINYEGLDRGSCSIADKG